MRFTSSLPAIDRGCVGNRRKSDIRFGCAEALARIGLNEVRQHRLKRLAEEERALSAGLGLDKPILPELLPVVIVRVEC